MLKLLLSAKVDAKGLKGNNKKTFLKIFIILFQVEARTLGWVALGLSHTKSIKGADLTIGWVSAAGQATLQDYHSIDGRTVKLDSSQDAELIVGFEDEDTTVLRFRRKVDTCDTDNDVKITNDTFRVIWAYGEADPADGVVDWTELARAGGRLLHLYQGSSSPTSSEANLKQWMVTSNQMTLPQKVRNGSLSQWLP
jgi:hypothetical protein